MEIPDAIGFPPPLLGEQPQRLPVLASGAGWLALDKPAGCLIDAHPWNQEAPSLVAGLRLQAEAGKPELAPFSITVPYATHYLDVETTGVALLAPNKESRGAIKEAIGSSQAQFTFQFVARSGPREDSLDCSLPLGEDASVPRAAVERRLGKKSHTQFQRLARCEGLSLWQASTALPRPQQVRVHAVASGFQICGERLFGEIADIAVGELKSRLRGPSAARPLFTGLALRLVELRLPIGSEAIVLSAEPSKPWQAMRRYFL